MGADNFFSIEDMFEDSSLVNCIFCKKQVELNSAVHMPGNGFICEPCAMRIERGLRGVRSGSTAIRRLSEYEDVIKEKEEEESYPEFGDIYAPVPTAIHTKLSEYVIGQERAKKALSVAAYNHYKRIQIGNNGIAKSNVLLIGPTGSGKTLLVNTLRGILGVPCVSVSATSLTENGYVGNDVEKTIELLLSSADGNIERAQKGIVFIDEIDKLVDNGTVSSTGNSVGRSGVQQALLTLIEGADVEVRNKTGRKVFVNTSNILFIFGGSFAGIEDIVVRRMKAGTGMGFGGNVFDADSVRRDAMENITTDDLKEFGMLSEFLGRAPSVAVMESVTVDLLERVLTEPKNGLIWQYQELLKYDGIEFEVEKGALKRIAELAYQQGVGCRGLRKICEELFSDIMYSLPGEDCSKVIYTEECIDGAAPVLVSTKRRRAVKNGL